MGPERNTLNKYLICYHANCIDGFTSAWVTWRCLIRKGVDQENITLKEVFYQSPELTPEYFVRDNAEYWKIYFVDFSISTKLISLLLNNGIEVRIIDHHKTAVEMYTTAYSCSEESFEDGFHLRNQNTGAEAKILLNQSECGASLCWKHFFNSSPEALIKYVKDYDLWQFKYSETKLINQFLRTADKTLDSWESIYYGMVKNVAPYIEMGSYIQKYHNKLVDDYVAQAQEVTIDTSLNIHTGLITNCSGHFASDVGHKLADKSKTFGATWCQLADGSIQFSLRSIGEYDVSEIAKYFGGGGHKNAAGFLFKPDNSKEVFLSNQAGVTIWRT